MLVVFVNFAETSSSTEYKRTSTMVEVFELPSDSDEGESDTPVMEVDESSAAAGDEVGTTKKKKKWVNRTRVLVLGSRGATFQHRHLMADLRRLMAHSKSESKFDDKHHVTTINEIAELNNCAASLYFETRKRQVTPVLTSE